MQICIGGCLGSFAAKWATRPGYDAAPEAIAASVAQSAGLPQLAPVIAAPEKEAPAGLAATVQTACTFGNSLTLPLLFLLTLFPASMEAKVTGYTALYLMAWSPLFWTLGYHWLTQGLRSQDQHGSEVSSETSGSWTKGPRCPSDAATGPACRQDLNGRNGASGQTISAEAHAVQGRHSPDRLAADTLPADMAELPSVAHLQAQDCTGRHVGIRLRKLRPDDNEYIDLKHMSSAQDGATEKLQPNGAAGVLANRSNGGSQVPARSVQLTPFVRRPRRHELTLPLLRRQGSGSADGAVRQILPGDDVSRIEQGALRTAFDHLAAAMTPPVAATLAGLLVGLSVLGTSPGAARRMASQSLCRNHTFILLD
jgi:predicted permease